MSWTSVETDAKSGETAVDSLKATVDGETAELTREDAAKIIKLCEDNSQKYQEIRMAVEQKQNLPQDEIDRNSLSEIRNASDAKEEKVYNKKHRRQAVTYTSASLGTWGRQTFVYETRDGTDYLQGLTLSFGTGTPNTVVSA